MIYICCTKHGEKTVVCMLAVGDDMGVAKSRRRRLPRAESARNIRTGVNWIAWKGVFQVVSRRGSRRRLGDQNLFAAAIAEHEWVTSA